MEPITFHGEAFSEYFCTKLLWNDPQLSPKIDQQAAEETYTKASSAIRYAQRQLRDREQARSTYTLPLARIAGLLGWRLGDTEKMVTELEQEEEGGAPLLDGDGDRSPPVRSTSWSARRTSPSSSIFPITPCMAPSLGSLTM